MGQWPASRREQHADACSLLRGPLMGPTVQPEEDTQPGCGRTVEGGRRSLSGAGSAASEGSGSPSMESSEGWGSFGAVQACPDPNPIPLQLWHLGQGAWLSEPQLPLRAVGYHTVRAAWLITEERVSSANASSSLKGLGALWQGCRGAPPSPVAKHGVPGWLCSWVLMGSSPGCRNEKGTKALTRAEGSVVSKGTTCPRIQVAGVGGLSKPRGVR